jgi:hypothetical protein
MCSDVRLWSVASQFLRNFVNRQRLAEVVALNFVAMMRPQECHLRFVFDPFGNHLQFEAVITASSGFAATFRINERSILSLLT